MKFVKYALIVIISLALIVIIVSLSTDKDYNAEKSIIINKPKSEVFDYIKHLKNQDEYSVWSSMDSNMKKEYRGIDATVGFVSSWESEVDDVGKGEQEIKKIVEGESIEYELRFIEPFQSIEDAYMKVESISESQTKVIWGFKGDMGVPGNLMLLFFDMEEMIGNDLEKGLKNLKSKLEAN